MQIVINNLKKEILELRQHIFYIKNISNEISIDSAIYPYTISITKKKFNYKSLIISLYGLVENYSEKFIIQYLESLSTLIQEYPNLKKVIQDKHLFNSTNLTLKVIEKKSIKYNHLKEFDLINNLHSCINNEQNYSLNYDSFTLLSGNLKHSKICDLFKQVDIDLNLEFRKLPDFSISNSENQFKKLDELVEMRNEVAHGNTNELLDPSEIEEYVDFIEKYFINLHLILVNDLIQEKLNYWKNSQSILLENCSVFRGNIVGFNNYKNILINTESEIIIEKKDNYFVAAKIISIKQFENNDVTLKLDFMSNLRDNYSFYIKQ